jgi:hypothetical protein
MPCVHSSVLNLTAPGLPWIRTFGSTGTGSTVGTAPQLSGVADTGGRLCTTPWSPSTVLVPDGGNGRVVEINFVTGLLVKVWLTGLDTPTCVAATDTLIAVGNRGATARVSLYNLNGVLVRAFGSTSLAAGDTSSVGVFLGYPSSLQFSQDGTSIVVAEAFAQRATRWSVATASFIESTRLALSDSWHCCDFQTTEFAMLWLVTSCRSRGSVLVASAGIYLLPGGHHGVLCYVCRWHDSGVPYSVWVHNVRPECRFWLWRACGAPVRSPRAKLGRPTP